MSDGDHGTAAMGARGLTSQLLTFARQRAGQPVTVEVGALIPAREARESQPLASSPSTSTRFRPLALAR